MFARTVSTIFIVLFFVFPMLAAATALPRTDPVEQCNTGSLQCCNSTQSSTSGVVGTIAALLGVVLGPVTGLIGVNCSPFTIIGGGGNSCTAQPVCCTGNNFNGALVLGCTPINIGL